jgi:CBS domain-containing protein
MTTDVVTVDPTTSVQALAMLLSERCISGVPVVDSKDRLVGIVSEGDLLHRVETWDRASDWASALMVAGHDRIGTGACPRLRQVAWPHGKGRHDA